MNSNETSKPAEAVVPVVPQNGKPARDERGHWLSGQWGNPGGRPKKKPVTEIYEEILRDPATREEVKQKVLATIRSGEPIGEERNRASVATALGARNVALPLFRLSSFWGATLRLGIITQEK